MWHARLILCGLGLVCLMAAFLPCWPGKYWVGQTGLHVIYTITDAQTRRPVSGAIITIENVGPGFCDNQGPQSGKTDAHGQWTRTWRDCMCFGYHGPWRDTFGMHLPEARFRAAAPGYSPCAWRPFEDPAYDKAVQRGDRCGVLNISIALTPDNSATR